MKNLTALLLLPVLAEIYIEALLVDEDAADAVWEAWDKGELSDFAAQWAWREVALSRCFAANSSHWCNIGEGLLLTLRPLDFANLYAP